jgi:hypothetical protein
MEKIDFDTYPLARCIKEIHLKEKHHDAVLEHIESGPNPAFTFSPDGHKLAMQIAVLAIANKAKVVITDDDPDIFCLECPGGCSK